MADPTPLEDLYSVIEEMHEKWDTDMKPGKLIIALKGMIPDYDPRVTRIRVALADTETLRDEVQRLRDGINDIYVTVPPGDLKICLGRLGSNPPRSRQPTVNVQEWLDAHASSIHTEEARPVDEPERQFRVGQPVEVRADYKYQEWVGTPLWISAVRAQPHSEFSPNAGEITYGVTDRWPPQNPGDITTDFKRSDLEPRKTDD